jgi:hypothetical protein
MSMKSNPKKKPDKALHHPVFTKGLFKDYFNTSFTSLAASYS